jgi:Skp family chaperone for outer membrane proteins
MKYWSLFLLLFLGVVWQSWALIYQWTDQYGNVVISNLTPESNVKYKVIDVDKPTIKFKSVWDIKNRATEKLEKMLRKMEEEKAKLKEMAEKKDEVQEKKENKNKSKNEWRPLVGKSQNSTGEIIVTVTEIKPDQYGNLPYDIFRVKIENLGGITIKFSRVFTKITLKNDQGITHSYIPKKVALKKNLPFGDKIPEDETLGPAEKKSYILAFSPIENPTVLVFDKFVNVDDGYVEIDLIKKEIEPKKEVKQVVQKEETKKSNLNLGDFGQLQGENIFASSKKNPAPPRVKKGNPPLPPLPKPPVAEGNPPVAAMKKEVPPDPFLGLRVREVDNSLVSKLNLRSKKGLYIEKVIMDSAAYNGGLKRGDIIETVNNKDVNSKDDLKKIIDNASRGESINFFVNRDNTWENFIVVKR